MILSWVLRDSIDSRGGIQGYALQKDSVTFQFGISQSGFNYGFEDFRILENNQILVDTGGIRIQNFVVASQGKTLRINGNISDNPNEILRINLRGVGMGVINYLVGYDKAQFEGEIEGDVILTELLGTPKFAADVRIDSLVMNNNYMGRLRVGSDWSVKEDTVHVDASMQLGEVTTLHGRGFYQPDSVGKIDFDLNLEQFRLMPFNPMFEGLAENLRGAVSGELQVEGNLGQPVVTGELNLPKTAFTVSFLQTDYNMVGAPVVYFRPGQIVFPSLTLRDTEYGSEGELIGEIKHDGFRDFELDMKVSA
ncbi:MAG: hypothetical protein U5L96_04905 [Owenweeksia sp.]|nr:hypothetical protein [Owenweeksia sp.]